jgi:hypothetical protein
LDHASQGYRTTLTPIDALADKAAFPMDSSLMKSDKKVKGWHSYFQFNQLKTHLENALPPTVKQKWDISMEYEFIS